MSVATEWDLHLLRVVIDDGEPECHVGDTFRWVASFWSEVRLTPSAETTKSAVPVGRHGYRINAEVVYISQDPRYRSCVLDFGIRALGSIVGHSGVVLPAGCQEGNFVQGEIRLESPLCTDVHAFDLNYTWRVNRVTADLANFTDKPADRGEVRYQDVSGTDAIKAPSYILHCSIEPDGHGAPQSR